MNWQTRLQEPSYTSPSGVVTVFEYEDVAREFDKKTSAYNFPDADGTYIQDLGSTGYRYPFRIFISGSDHDLRADAFLESLRERGEGILNHPRYGTINVVPFGRVNMRDNLKTAANQSIIDVLFFETIGFTYPTSSADAASLVQQTLEEFNTQQSAEFESVIDLDTAVERAQFESEYDVLLNNVRTNVQEFTNAVQDVQQQFDVIFTSINRNIDILVADPITLALQTSNLIQTPARALFAISTRLEGYANIIANITSTSPTTENEFNLNKSFAYNALTGMVISVTNGQFETKPQAVEAVETLLTQFDNVNTWVDDNITVVNANDTGAAYQQLQESVALAAGFLVELSFSLAQEFTIVLDRDRTIIDLAAELYGEVDERLDFLIDSNSLSGSEILTLKRGREIVYYI